MSKRGSNLNYLNKYSTFDTTRGLNAAVDGHIKRNQYELNETDRDVIVMLSQYSVKYSGVAHLKLSTIADIIGKSVQTARRSINKLSELNVIKRQAFMKPITGGNGANIYIILPYDDTPQVIGRKKVAKPTPVTDKADNIASEPITFISKSNTDDSNRSAIERLINDSIPNNTPRELVDILSPFFYGSELYKYVGIVFKAKYRPHISIRIEDYADEFRAVISDVIRRFKQGYIRSLDGYLYASIRSLAKRLHLNPQ